MPAIEIVEVAARGLVTARSLAIVARLMPDAGLSAGAALVAGLIGAFVRYFAEQYLSDTNLGDTGFIEEADQRPSAHGVVDGGDPERLVL